MVNIDGFLNMLVASNEAQVKSFICSKQFYYGDHPDLPKKEEVIENPLSPQLQFVNELYADVFSRVYDFHSID